MLCKCVHDSLWVSNFLPIYVKHREWPGGGRFRWNAFISFQMSPIGVNRLNLDANECQDLVRSELKTRLQFAAACLYA